MSKKSSDEQSAMIRIASFIVDKRNLFFLIFAIAILFSCFSTNWVRVENDLSMYLSEDTETRRGLDLMDEQYVTYGTARVMVANVSFSTAKTLKSSLEKQDGVQSVTFVDDDEDDAAKIRKHYNQGAALFEVTFDYNKDDDRALTALDGVKQSLDGYDFYVSTTLGDQEADAIASEMKTIVIIVAIVVVAVLFLTSLTYGEVPVLLLTFIAAAIINKGTNFIFGKISFVSNSVAVVLQLALSIDYAIIFCNRYKEEHRTREVRDAVIVALSKAIPEISSSSLTTVSGLLAMTFMKFKIGQDLGFTLTKAILLSLASVFLLMPGLLVLFSGLMERTKHRNFVPDIPFVGKFACRTRKIIPPVFLLVVCAGIWFSNQCPYVYGSTLIKTPIQNEQQRTDALINSVFGRDNYVAVNIPGSDYQKESDLIRDLEACSEVDHVTSLANTEIANGYNLTEPITPRQFSEMMDVDYDLCTMLYSMYAADQENYGRIIGGVESYRVSFMDMFLFLYDKIDEGYITLDSEDQKKLDDTYVQITSAKAQLRGNDYDRMLVYLTLPEEGTETFSFLDRMHDIAGKYFDKDKVLIVGDATSEYDQEKSFSTDNITVNVVSILFVLVILLFTFQSVGMPLLLIAVIQGSIYLNFAYPAIVHQTIFYLSYLIVDSIQMGANIDYAIVIASRYQELRKSEDRRTAIINTMNFAFPTIITSGTILAVAGTLIGMMTSNTAIFGVGQCLGRGTVISILLVMFALPQILILGDRVIAKTAFTITTPIKNREETGLVRVDGVVSGTINGHFTGQIHGFVRGDVNLNIIAGNAGKEETDHEDNA